jgi:PAS domain S-box-containing protein
MVGKPQLIVESITRFFAKPLGISSFFVVLALLWTFPLQHVIAYPFVFLFFGAVMCSAWFGGFIAGLMAVVMSSILVTYFFIPPFYSMAIGKEFQSYVAAFVICAIAVTALSSARKKSETAVRASRDELELRVQQRTAELERSNSEIRQREQQLQLLTEAIPQQIWRTDAHGSVEFCNSNLVDYIGVDGEDLRGNALFSFYHPEDAASFRQIWSDARRDCAQFEVQARVRGINGSYRWFLIRSNPQLAANGEVVCWYGVHIDIEDQRKAQQALLLAQDDLARFSRTFSMAEMAASIAHELNQPLTALMSDANACRRWLNVEPANLERAVAASERIIRDTTRASEVVSRIRSLFTKSAYVRQTTDLNVLIQDLARLLRDESLRYGVSIRLRLSDRLPPMELDPVQIQQVLLNLAMNGMEAMAGTDGPRVLEISSEFEKGKEVLVTVRDYGVGLREEIAAKMFDPFFSTKPAGTGMGLAICRSIIEAHDGRIWADPLERGTAFHFSLGVGAS